MEFSWWGRDSVQGKFQVCARYHGGDIKWQRQVGRFTSWEPYPPSPEDWERLLAEAARRVPRRLLSPRQFEEIKRRRERAAL
jgi:hypothetical protein